MQETDKNIIPKKDLVNYLDHFSIFMYVNDLAYKQTPDGIKHYSIEKHDEDLKNLRKPNYTSDNPNKLDTLGIFRKIMTVLWKHNINYSIVDVGSQYGSFAMELGTFIKKTGHVNKVYAFDCGIASTLCFDNIKLNLLDDVIIFERKAVTNESSPQKVFFDTEHSEDNHIVHRNGEKLASYVIDGITLDEYFRDHDENFLMKIDTQGAEPLVFEGMKNLMSRNPTIMFEFTPWTFDLIKRNPVDFLKNIPSGYTMFEFQPGVDTIFRIDRDKIEGFVQSVSESTAKWTDLLIIHNQSIVYEEILNEIKKYKNFDGTKTFSLPN